MPNMKRKMLAEGEGKSKDFSNGPEAAKMNKMRKEATSGRGKVKQTRGKAESGAKARYHSLAKEKKFSEDIEF